MIISPKLVYGRARLSIVHPSLGWLANHAEEDNLVLYSWGTIAAQLLANGNAAYKIGAMFLEFENNGGATVTPPTYDRTGGIAYYNGLSSSPTRDYLRVPITAATLSTDTPSIYSNNVMTFFAQSSGVAGIHGKTFSDSVKSMVFGAALVCTPNFNDPTQDIVFSRIYFSAAGQQVKLPSSQVGVTWPISLQ